MVQVENKDTRKRITKFVLMPLLMNDLEQLVAQ